MQNLDFNAVNSSNATDTKDESVCQFVQSLKLRITALDLIILVRYRLGWKFDGMCK
jgi:hypothetical protein